MSYSDNSEDDIDFKCGCDVKDEKRVKKKKKKNITYTKKNIPWPVNSSDDSLSDSSNSLTSYSSSSSSRSSSFSSSSSSSDGEKRFQPKKLHDISTFYESKQAIPEMINKKDLEAPKKNSELQSSLFKTLPRLLPLELEVDSSSIKQKTLSTSSSSSPSLILPDLIDHKEYQKMNNVMKDSSKYQNEISNEVKKLNLPKMMRIEQTLNSSSSPSSKQDANIKVKEKMDTQTLKKLNLPTMIPLDQTLGIQSSSSVSSKKPTWDIKTHLSNNLNDTMKSKISSSIAFNTSLNQMMNSSSSTKTQSPTTSNTSEINTTPLGCHNEGNALLCNATFLNENEPQYASLLEEHDLMKKIHKIDGIIVIIPSKEKISKMLKTLKSGDKDKIAQDRVRLKNLLLKPALFGTIGGSHITLNGDLATLAKIGNVWVYGRLRLRHHKNSPKTILYIHHSGAHKGDYYTMTGASMIQLSKMEIDKKDNSFNLSYISLNGTPLNHSYQHDSKSSSDTKITSKNLTLKQFSFLNIYTRYKDNCKLNGQFEMDINDCIKNIHSFESNDKKKKNGHFDTFKPSKNSVLTKEDFKNSLFELSVDYPGEKDYCFTMLFNMKQLQEPHSSSSYVLVPLSSQSKPLAIFKFNDETDELSSIQMDLDRLKTDDVLNESHLLERVICDSPTIISFKERDFQYDSMSNFTQDLVSFDANRLGKFFKRRVLRKKGIIELQEDESNSSFTPSSSSLSSIHTKLDKEVIMIQTAPMDSSGSNLNLKLKKRMPSSYRASLSLHVKQSDYLILYTFNGVLLTKGVLLKNIFPDYTAKKPKLSNEHGLMFDIKIPDGQNWGKFVTKSIPIGLSSSKSSKMAFANAMLDKEGHCFKATDYANRRVIYVFFNEENMTHMIVTSDDNLVVKMKKAKIDKEPIIKDGEDTSSTIDTLCSKQVNTFSSSSSSPSLSLKQGISSSLTVDTSKEDISLATFIAKEVKELRKLNSINYNDLLQVRMDSISSHFTQYGQEIDIQHVESQLLGVLNELTTRVMTLASKDNVILYLIKENPHSSLSEYENITYKDFINLSETQLNTITDTLCNFGSKTPSSKLDSDLKSPHKKRFEKVVNSIFNALKYDQMNDKSQRTQCLTALNIISSHLMKSLLTINSFHKESFSKQLTSNDITERVDFHRSINNKGYNAYKSKWYNLYSDVC